MTFVLTGSLGNISKPLAELLVKSGKKVVVISSSADRQRDIEALGATAAIGSLEDATFLAATFAGAEAVYAMVPPKYDEPDNNLYYKRIANNYAKAIRSSGVKKVVLLSSYGADQTSGTGFILGIHHAEEILKSIVGVSFTFLRAGYFYTNLINFFKPLIQHAGIIGSNYGGSDRFLLVHPADIAQAAAEELQGANDVGAKILYVGSDIRTADEVAAVLGPVINKPDLKWVTFPTADAIQGMTQGGMPPAAAAAAAEMGDAIHSGLLISHYDSLASPPALYKTKLEDYAVNDFATAYFA